MTKRNSRERFQWATDAHSIPGVDDEAQRDNLERLGSVLNEIEKSERVSMDNRLITPMVEIWTRVTVFMGVMMGLFPLLHVWEMYRSQSSASQSFVGVIFWELGIMTWLIYGILKKDRVIVIANWIALTVGIFYLFAIRYYS